MHHYKITIFLLLFSLSLFSMDPLVISLPKELLYRDIELQNDRQIIGRFGQTCHENQNWYRNLMVCKDPHNNDCTSPLCCFMAEPDCIPMQPLVLYAQQYTADTSNIHARNMFIHLWRHDDEARSRAVQDVMDITDPTLSDYLEIYAGQYADKEMKSIEGMRSGLAKAIRSAIIQHNSCKLKSFLIHKKFLEIQTLLLSNTLLFDPYRENDTILDCACALNDSGIITQIVNASRSDCVVSVIKSMIRAYHIELLSSFMGMHIERAHKERFVLWKCAVGDRRWNNSRASDKDSALERQVFEVIVTLLFSQEMNAQDEFKRPLINYAIEENNVCAVKFLIEYGEANVSLAGYQGSFPLYDAYENPEIIRLLLQKGADINQRHDRGRTAFMSSICHAKFSKKSKKVMEILLDAGADVTAIDYDGKSVLHHYAERMSDCWGNKELMIRMLLKSGAPIDQQDSEGKTPLDYAAQNYNSELIDVLNSFKKEEFLDENLVSTVKIDLPSNDEKSDQITRLQEENLLHERIIPRFSYKKYNEPINSDH